MRIKRLHIGDFGILQNQTLEDLNSGLVVVGGHNRAGKSTFMQVLRYLGYGIPGSSAFRCNVEYMVDADVLDEISGLLYHIRLQGAADPVCTGQERGPGYLSPNFIRWIPLHTAIFIPSVWISWPASRKG